MAFCRKCGSLLADDADFCSSCGTAQNVAPAQNAAPNQNTYNPASAQNAAPNQNTYIPASAPAPEDNGGFGWGALGCCVPIVGLILFLVWKDTKPKTAKAAGKGALISVIISVIFYILSFVLAGIGAAMM